MKDALYLFIFIHENGKQLIVADCIDKALALYNSSEPIKQIIFEDKVLLD